MSQAYQKAGVNLRAGDEAVERIKIHARSTHRPEVIGGLGGFSGLFTLDTQKYRKPILVSGTDGVGTKLKLAFELDQHDTVGIDLVAMCVNDILVTGAEPLYFLDYIACEKLEPEKIEKIVGGIAEGCRQAQTSHAHRRRCLRAIPILLRGPSAVNRDPRIRRRRPGTSALSIDSVQSHSTCHTHAPVHSAVAMAG